MATNDSPPTFDKDQLTKYFDHIQLPKKYYGDNVAPDLAFLTVLHRHQIAAIPYENLSLHYSQPKTIDLDAQVLYTKFVTNGRNRGGYCMEGSLFFLHILRSLGYQAYPTVVRIRLREDGVPKGDYVTITHIVLIIELPTKDGLSEKYVCDAAFGGDGPLFPMPLKEGIVTQNLGTQEIRFAYERIPKATSQKFWIYQYRNGPDKPWNSFYAFMDAECLENDFAAVNFFTSQAPTFQKTTVIVVKFILGPAEETGQHKITGKLLLVNGIVKRNMGGKTEVVEECKTESERIQALKTWFGISLTEEETLGIKDSVTELKAVEVLGA
ncbi:hypothetical protein N0V93_008137 [Gnomoniopsis smithogilvyi]|uniref:Arylamine N-acetyltransferase n=1 Tax=Gnomoniopsis smithogilvyi TaxID=1191159 RepID=A0A9W9CUH1_9PEZI|nr:hypothetical protein N0V93_008137 [Gnomoniopsis smithogilvyi]